MYKFESLSNLMDIASSINLEERNLTYILYKKRVERLYVSFTIPKKDGGIRQINAPAKELKGVQRRIARAILNQNNELKKANNTVSNVCHGFEKGKGIISNAQMHRNKKIIVNIDLNNFFPSIHFGRVKGYFEKNSNFNFSSEAALILAQLCCFDGSLPQGSPTSPVIANLICNILDMRLIKLSKKYKLNYTRYADDMTFSTNNKYFIDQFDEFYTLLENHVKQAGFAINEKKTRIQYNDSRQEVTGLVVNKRINTKREFYKDTRAMAHKLYKDSEFFIDGIPGTINQLEGRFSFINQIEKYDNIKNKKRTMKNNYNNSTLNSKEIQYQKFIFYKIFFMNEKPLIITEGKTDVLYIKAALMKLHKDYPLLITKLKDGSFEYKISFLKRTKRLRYFFDLQLVGGADSISRIIDFFIDKKNRNVPNYLKYFNGISGTKANNPVIAIFDNELKKGKNSKPLRKIVDILCKNKLIGDYETFDDLYKNICDNLYIMTNPLVGDKEECEIEDLFTDETLLTEIDGRTFDRKVEKGNSRCYGKQKFAEYIFENSKDIDFSGFKPLLDKLNEICSSYK